MPSQRAGGTEAEVINFFCARQHIASLARYAIARPYVCHTGGSVENGWS